MKKRILSLVLALLFTVGIFGAANSAFAMEDGDYRIVFGADLTDEQRSQVIGMFGIQGEVDENRILTVTNAEERLYFEGKIPSGQIGQRSISSIYICAMPAGSGRWRRRLPSPARSAAAGAAPRPLAPRC